MISLKDIAPDRILQFDWLGLQSQPIPAIIQVKSAYNAAFFKKYLNVK